MQLYGTTKEKVNMIMNLLNIKNRYLIGTDFAKGNDYTRLSVWENGIFIVDYPDIIKTNVQYDERKRKLIDKFVKELLSKKDEG